MKFTKKIISFPFESEKDAKESLTEELKKYKKTSNIKIIKTPSSYYYEFETEINIIKGIL